MRKIRTLIIFIITLVLIVSIYHIGIAQDQIQSNLSGLCKGILNSMDCAEKIEKYQFKKGLSGVSRLRDKLIITLKSGKNVIFTDSNNDDVNGKWYQYREYLAKIEYHIIHLQYYEGEGYIFLNADNGQYRIIQDIPLISPDAKRIAVFSDCDAYCVPGIEIYRMTKSNIIKEFSLTPKEYWAGGKLQWFDKHNIRVSINILDDQNNQRQAQNYKEKSFFIYYIDNGWKTKNY